MNGDLQMCGECFQWMRVAVGKGYEHLPGCPRYEAPPKRRVKTIRARKPKA